MAQTISFYSNIANAIICTAHRPILGRREETTAKPELQNTWKQFIFSVIFTHTLLYFPSSTSYLFFVLHYKIQKIQELAAGPMPWYKWHNG